jgi:hypothetical protein
VKQSRFKGNSQPHPFLVRNYFSKPLFFQNADLIEAHPLLADLFRSFFNDNQPILTHTLRLLLNVTLSLMSRRFAVYCCFSELLSLGCLALTTSAADCDKAGYRGSPFAEDFSARDPFFVFSCFVNFFVLILLYLSFTLLLSCYSIFFFFCILSSVSFETSVIVTISSMYLLCFSPGKHFISQLLARPCSPTMELQRLCHSSQEY